MQLSQQNMIRCNIIFKSMLVSIEFWRNKVEDIQIGNFLFGF
jgi:hypothetical protein